MRKYLTTFLLIITLPLGELHTFWEYKEEYRGEVLYQEINGNWQPAEKVNWIINKNEPMTIQWNVKLAMGQLCVILYFIAMWFYPNNRNKLNIVTVILFIELAIVDTLLYFWDFKTKDYHVVYYCVALTYLISFRKEIKKYLFG